jgi:hypothetical protein
MHYLLIDTCIWLNLAKSKNQYALVETLERLIDTNEVVVLVPELVRTEFDRNRDRVIDSTRQQIGAEFRKVKQIIESYGSEKKSEALQELNDVGCRLPLLSEVTGYMADRLIALMDKGRQIDISDSVKLRAVTRALTKKAPFHKQKNSVADAILIEVFHEFKKDVGSGIFHFITDNHTDFSSPIDKRKPHIDLDDIFTGDAVYHLDLVDAIKTISPKVFEEIEEDLGWVEDDTRGLTEILNSVDELQDKVWYNRHMIRLYYIEQGKIQIIPKGTKRFGNDVIHEDILEGAMSSAEKVRAKYDDLGPWDDFEWGMINGKLSALRWILGDEWNMLDT